MAKKVEQVEKVLVSVAQLEELIDAKIESMREAMNKGTCPYAVYKVDWKSGCETDGDDYNCDECERKFWENIRKKNVDHYITQNKVQGKESEEQK